MHGQNHIKFIRSPFDTGECTSMLK